MDMTRVHIPNKYGHHSHHLDASKKKKNIKWLLPSPQHIQATAVAATSGKGGYPKPMLSTPKRAATVTQHLDVSKCSSSSKEA